MPYTLSFFIASALMAVLCLALPDFSGWEDLLYLAIGGGSVPVSLAALGVYVLGRGRKMPEHAECGLTEEQAILLKKQQQRAKLMRQGGIALIVLALAIALYFLQTSEIFTKGMLMGGVLAAVAALILRLLWLGIFRSMQKRKMRREHRLISQRSNDT